MKSLLMVSYKIQIQKLYFRSVLVKLYRGPNITDYSYYQTIDIIQLPACLQCIVFLVSICQCCYTQAACRKHHTDCPSCQLSHYNFTVGVNGDISTWSLSQHNIRDTSLFTACKIIPCPKSQVAVPIFSID